MSFQKQKDEALVRRTTKATFKLTGVDASNMTKKHYEIKHLINVVTLGKGAGVGDLALIKNKPRAATVRVSSEKCIMAVLNKEDY